MQYLLLIHDDERKYAKLTEEEYAGIVEGYKALTAELQERGVYVGSNRLAPTSEASSVRVRDEELVVTDGPFAETKEQLGGFFLIDVGSLEEARAWAARIPTARYGTVEVRPVFPVQAEVTSG